MTEATQEGASVAERLDSFLQPEATNNDASAEPETEDEVSESPIEETETEVLEAKEPETDDEVEEVEAETTEETDVNDDVEDSLDLDDFATLLGVDSSKIDLDENGSPVFKTKIDGVEGTVKIDDLIKSHQLEGHLNNKNMEVIEAKKALDAQRQEFQGAATQRLQQLDGALNLANQQLYNEFNQIDWKGLETQDPSNYVVMRQKFADRQQQIQNSMNTLQTQNQEKQQQAEAELGQRVEQERQALFNKVPEWNTEETWIKGNAEIRTGLSKHYGIEEEVLNDIVDHRFVLIARDAMKYKALQEGKPATLNKVKKAPKVIKSGAPKAKSKVNDKLLSLRKQVKDSGGKRGVTALLMEQGII